MDRTSQAEETVPRPPDTGDAGLWHGARVRRGWWTTPGSPVCAAAVGGSNGRADPTVVSRLPWQNRDSRCKTGGRMICAPTQRPKGIPYFVNSPEIFPPGPRWGRLSPSRGCKGQGEVI